jgi:Family of unknown function (DUF5652)
MSQDMSINLMILGALTWSLVWKGIALWKAGRNNQMGWFIFIFLINTLGILEIVYLIGFQWDRND